ncbi:MAG: hypothetical protein IT306_26650 [Chloroflexi bacterium]|nr:hypothetical protein [Chloroflexota bacterium]
MSGATESNEDLVSGRVNRANHMTTLWVEQPDPDEPDDFQGDAMLFVGVSQDVEDPDDWADDPGKWSPLHAVNGIVGSGFSRFAPYAAPGGVGVVGQGGGNAGTGVLGVGSGAENGGLDGKGGLGGIGVHGIGGDREPSPTFDPTIPPGPGVVGQGGRQSDPNTDRLPHAAGVIGVAGSRGMPVAPFSQTAGVGVYGQGAESTLTMSPAGAAGGPLFPGPGVLGRGGVPTPRNGSVAAGVVGLAGDSMIPSFMLTRDTGVYGAADGIGTGVVGDGPTGVHGYGATTAGVHGEGRLPGSRGGVFQANDPATPQVTLVPADAGTAFFDGRTVAPTAFAPSLVAPYLPRRGNDGDLMALKDNQRVCTLWFCVRGQDGSRPAQWVQVLTGPAFEGER